MLPLKFGDKKLMGFIHIKPPHEPAYTAIIYLSVSGLSSSSPGTVLFYVFSYLTLTSFSAQDGKEHNVLSLAIRIYL